MNDVYLPYKEIRQVSSPAQEYIGSVILVIHVVLLGEGRGEKSEAQSESEKQRGRSER